MVPIILLILAAPGVGTVETVRIDCPDRIYTREELAVEVPGWEGWGLTYPALNYVEDPSIQRHEYSGMSFYHKHPSNHMLLAADPGEGLLTYSFGDSAADWAVCHYEGTPVTFTRPIGPGLSRCVIVKEKAGKRDKDVGICYRG